MFYYRDYANSKEIADLFKNADKRSEISVLSSDRHKSVNLNQTTLNQSICDTSFLLYGSGLSDDKNKELIKLCKKMKVKCKPIPLVGTMPPRRTPRRGPLWCLLHALKR